MTADASLAHRLAEALPAAGWRTRFAPAPTGFLHLGHLVNAIYVWGIARAYGGEVVLRVEDHDRTRCRPEYEAALHEDLAWLGLTADIAAQMPRQSDRSARYAAALALLEASDIVYPCLCTRREIAAMAPRVAGDERRYPGTCRSRRIASTDTVARRVRMDSGEETFEDVRLGQHRQDPSAQCGDVLVRDRHASWTYQFAVVVDDFDQQIDVIIRGEDLLASTGRQWRLARLLGRTVLPRTLHHPLVTHPDGTKLSKANGDTALRDRRRAGATPEELFGEAACLAGLQPTSRTIAAADLADLFR